MAMVDEARIERLTLAIAAELQRQGVKADARALAEAAAGAVQVPASRDEGKTPDELNASNDE